MTKGTAVESEMLPDAGRSELRVMEAPIGVRYDVDCSTENLVMDGLTVASLLKYKK